MNSFFFKNLISSSSNNKNQDEEQSDFERLIQLCNSYGLNEEQTKQLIDEFKKGSYKSGNNSLNQSMVSDQHDMSMSENEDQTSRNYQQSQNRSLQPSRASHHQKHHHNYYEQQPYYQASQNSNNYYGYENEMQQKNEESYNEMTFNQQNNSLMINSHRFHEGHGHFMGESSKGNTLKQEIILQQKIHERPVENKFVEDKPLERNNSQKQTLMQKRSSNQQSIKNINHGMNNTEPTRNCKQSISTKLLSQQNENGSQFHTSKSQQNSIQQHSIENQPINGLNPEYVKALIRNFELLQGQNETLKEENQLLQKNTQCLMEENEMIKKECERVKKGLEDMKNREKFSTHETAKFEAVYEAEKQKNQMLMGMKQKDSELIKGLKDSLMQLTQLIKQKDCQNNDLQQRLFSLYERFQNQGSTKYLGSQASRNEFDQTEGSTQTYYGKSFSKKSLVSSESAKSIKAQGQEESRERERSSNYGRKELTEIMGNNINLPQKNQSIAQQSRQLVRQPSASRLNSSNQQINFKKSSSNASQAKQQQRESKQNVFTPLQVQPAIKRNLTHNSKQTEDENKKRPSSRVDIKKYKGMIEQLRNSYSNVGNGNQMMR